MVCLWKSYNLDKRALRTYMRVTVNKDIDKCSFTLSQAMIFDWWWNQNDCKGTEVIDFEERPPA